MREMLTPRCITTLVATVGNFKLYECPKFGDENPLICEYEGIWYRTGFWDVPTLEELIDDFYGEPF
jgi:hypothetical protein